MSEEWLLPAPRHEGLDAWSTTYMYQCRITAKIIVRCDWSKMVHFKDQRSIDFSQ